MALVTPGALSQQPPAPAPTCTITEAPAAESVALVLSGGGAHGIAHIGVLEVLDSLGVRPNLVVGTSIGALVGALYASGMSGKQLDSVVRRLPLEKIFHRYPPTAFIAAGDPSRVIVTQSPAFVLEQYGTSVRVQSPAVRERQVNELFAQLLLRGNMTAAGDFSRLPIPFIAVATDMRTRAPVVLQRGDLAQAVRASAAIPIVFAPVVVDEHMLIDGGLSANVPVAIARRTRATRVIVSDVGSDVARPVDAQSTAGMLSYLLDFIFTQPPYALNQGDVAIRPSVDAFGLLNFARDALRPVRDSGYAAARQTLSGCQPRSGPPRRSRGVPSADEHRIADRLARLMDEGVYESVWLNPRRGSLPADSSSNPSPSTRDTRLTFTPVATVAPGRIAAVGLGYDSHDGVDASVTSASTALGHGQFAVSGALTLGEWRQQLLLVATALRRHPLRAPNPARPGSLTEILPDPRVDEPPWSMLTRDLVRPALSLTGTRETIRLYDALGHEVARPATRDFIAFAGLTATFSGGWQSAAGPIEHVWWDNNAGPGIQAHNGTGAILRAARLFGVRTSGPDQSSIPAIAGELLWTNRYRRAVATADLIADGFGFQFRTRGSLGAGRELPLSSQLVLGGRGGFPGLMTGERRGDPVAFASVAIAHPFIGPLYWRLDIGRGWTRVDTAQSLGELVGQGWITGGDAGMAADTPLGPLTISYGVATGRRRVFTLRIGG